MQANTKHVLVVCLVILLVVLIGAWWYSDFSLDFMRFFASQDGGVTAPDEDVDQPATPAPPAGTVRCAPLNQTVAVNTSATLTGSGGQADFTWTALGGSPSSGTGASFTVTYAEPGVKKVVISGPRELGEGITTRAERDSIACTVTVTSE